MDDGHQAVQDVFIQLHDEGLIYRGNRLSTGIRLMAISDLEVISTEEKVIYGISVIH